MTGSVPHNSELSKTELNRDLSQVKIDIASSGIDSWKVSGILPENSLTELAAECKIMAPGLVNIIITKEKDLWRVQGELEIAIELPCSRCLKQYNSSLMINVDRFFALGKDPALSFGQVEMESDVVFLESGEFSLLRFAEEEFILILPMIPLCDEGCSGLCQSCGADKNIAPCDCSKEEKPNPFAILGKMKID
ncbi:MAG: DUF177 domain-containing protein [Magnetococcales bacterium]|nr:DUF177 domain-containing protein [Magnetococcales bacterium]